jgi:putative ABC transport system permease protein
MIWSTILDTVIYDLGHGCRAIVKHVRFSVLVIMTLALGIGASTTVFSVINAVLLQPLPYAESDRLVWLWSIRSENPLKQRVSYPDFVDWRTASETLELVGYGALRPVLTGTGDPQRLRATLFVGDLFALLGVSPMLGSASRETVSDGEPVVVLSQALWRRRFNADPDVVGMPVALDGVRYTVAAVMPAGFQFPIQAATSTDVWIPLKRFNPALAEQRGARLIEVIGRMRRGVTLEQAQVEMDLIASNLSAQYPETNGRMGVRVTAALQEVTGNVSRGLWLLSAAVAALLLIGCVNVANLLLVRTAGRDREIAIRAALGAGSARLACQLLLESVLLAVIAGLFGCFFAHWGVDALGALLADSIPRASEISVNGYVLGFAVVVTLGTGLLFGLAPALEASTLDLTRPLKQGAAAVSRGVARKRLADVLIVGEVALAMILLTAAGLFIHSFWKLDRSDAPENVLTFELTWPAGRYPNPVEAFRRLRARLLTIPGVLEASTGLQLPDRGEALLDDTSPFVEVEGQSVARAERQRVATLTIQSGYFRALGIPLLAGRDFGEDDRAGRPRVVVINESLARAYLVGEDPIGRQISLDSWVLRGESAAEIVGVVSDVKHRGLQEAQPLVYLPMEQWPAWESPMVLSTSQDPLTFVPAVREVLASIDPDQPMDDIRTLEQRIAGALSEDRSRALLLGAFSSFAVLLAAIGLYGVLSYATSQRVREIGIRLALGAHSGDVLRAVVGQGMKRVLTGMLIGLFTAVALTGVVDNLLFEISPADPVALAVVTAILIFATVLACAIPALRAARTEPASVLRCD